MIYWGVDGRAWGVAHSGLLNFDLEVAFDGCLRLPFYHAYLSCLFPLDLLDSGLRDGRHFLGLLFRCLFAFLFLHRSTFLLLATERLLPTQILHCHILHVLESYIASLLGIEHINERKNILLVGLIRCMPHPIRMLIA